MIRLNDNQKRYAKKAYRQIKDTGVALIQIPTGQGKTLIALKVIAEILSHSRRPRPVVLVTRKMEDEVLLDKAFRGESISREEYDNHPWIRDAVLAKGLSSLHNGRSPKFDYIECRSLMNQCNSFPAGSIVVFDEVHRFQTFLRSKAERAYSNKPGRHCSGAKERKYLLLSATPINPTRISSKEERGVLSFDEEEKMEDNRIKTGYLNLYKTMIGLSSLSRTAKNNLLKKLDEGKNKPLEDFAVDLRTVMRVLKPIPSPDALLKLGPKGRTPICPAISFKPPGGYSRSILGLLKFHAAMTNKISLYYCAERMALAGVRAKRGVNTVGFVRQPKTFSQKGIFHYQPDAPYMDQTLKALRFLERNNQEIRSLLSGKIEALYDFLLRIWKKRSSKPKWKVLVYCAHRGSVASLAAELEKRFFKDGIVCTCPVTNSDIYGKHGSKRVVWDTEGYATTDRTQSEQEDVLKREFCSDINKAGCRRRKTRCPRGFVLVTSDRLSESIDLHNTCEILIHFDLDWSPLRMIQRYGRLWRIEKPKRSPKPPAVYHMVQPGSVDEEILWRLEKRWESLRKLNLGLELVDFKHTLGKRIY